MVFSKGRFDLSDSTQVFTIDYDPTIRANELWRKLTDTEIQERFVNFHISRPLNDLVPAISADRVSIFSIVVCENEYSTEIISELDLTEKQFYLYKNSIENKNIPILSTYASEFIEYIFRTVLFWYKMNLAIKENARCRKVTLLIRWGFAMHLPMFEKSAARSNHNEYCVFGTMELAS